MDVCEASVMWEKIWSSSAVSWSANLSAASLYNLRSARSSVLPRSLRGIHSAEKFSVASSSVVRQRLG